MALKHENNGMCVKCLGLFLKYPGFHRGLQEWFFDFQKKHPEAHISEAGRGKEMQELLYRRKATRARYGESAHNWNCALDIWENGSQIAKDIYEEAWFRKVLEPELPSWVTWYGKPGSKFREMPHIEVSDWRQLVAKRVVRLVEPNDE